MDYIAQASFDGGRQHIGDDNSTIDRPSHTPTVPLPQVRKVAYTTLTIAPVLRT